jgi:hypothetical protein
MLIIGTAERYGEHYELVRFYERGGSDIVGRYMTLDEARDYCAEPESSSSTATSDEANARTAERGPWFIGYRQA